MPPAAVCSEPVPTAMAPSPWPCPHSHPLSRAETVPIATPAPTRACSHGFVPHCQLQCRIPMAPRLTSSQRPSRRHAVLRHGEGKGLRGEAGLARRCPFTQPVSILPGERSESRAGYRHPGQGPTVPGRVPPPRPSPGAGEGGGGGGGRGRAGPGSPPAAPWLAADAGEVPEGSGRRRRGAAGGSGPGPAPQVSAPPREEPPRPAPTGGGAAPPATGYPRYPLSPRPQPCSPRGAGAPWVSVQGRGSFGGSVGGRNRGAPTARPPRVPALRGVDVAPRGPTREGRAHGPSPRDAAAPIPSSTLPASPSVTAKLEVTPRHRETPRNPRCHPPPHGSSEGLSRRG